MKMQLETLIKRVGTKYREAPKLKIYIGQVLLGETRIIHRKM